MKARIFILAAVLSVLLLVAGSALADGSAVGTYMIPVMNEKASKPDISDTINILLAGFESDDRNEVKNLIKKDITGRIEADRRMGVTLSIIDDFIMGLNLKDAARNAVALGDRYDYDFVVWGGRTGDFVNVVVTAIPRKGDDVRLFSGLGYSQSFQFYLDMPFHKNYKMVTDALFGMVDFVQNNVDEAITNLEKCVKADKKDVLSLNVIRIYLGSAYILKARTSNNADDGTKAVRNLYKVFDNIKQMGTPELFGAVKANLLYAYLEKKRLVPKGAATYERKARKSLSDAMGVFKEEKYPSHYACLKGELDKLNAPPEPVAPKVSEEPVSTEEPTDSKEQAPATP